MQALIIKVENILGQMELINNFYKDGFDNVLDSNINDTMTSTIDTNPLLKQTTLTTQPGTPFDIPLSSGLFIKIASNADKNSSPSAKKSSSPTLPPSIVFQEPSKSLSRPFGNYGKLNKRKPRAMLIS